jgi:hypothetical protein
MWLAAAAALCGCGGVGRLAPDAPAGVSLAGTWKLNPAASDDPHALLERMRRDAMKHMRAQRGPDTDSDLDPEAAPQGGQRTGQRGDQRGDRRSRGRAQSGTTSDADTRAAGSISDRRGAPLPNAIYQRALASQLNGDELTIEQSPAQLVLARGDSRRSFTPGGESVVSVADGVADQRSGWTGREYVIELKPQVGPRVIERYGLSAESRQLIEKLTLSDEGMPKLEFTRVYDRGVATQHALPTSN